MKKLSTKFQTCAALGSWSKVYTIWVGLSHHQKNKKKLSPSDFWKVKKVEKFKNPRRLSLDTLVKKLSTKFKTYRSKGSWYHWATFAKIRRSEWFLKSKKGGGGAKFEIRDPRNSCRDVLVKKLIIKFQICKVIGSWLEVRTIEPPSQKKND